MANSFVQKCYRQSENGIRKY